MQLESSNAGTPLPHMFRQDPLRLLSTSSPKSWRQRLEALQSTGCGGCGGWTELSDAAAKGPSIISGSSTVSLQRADCQESRFSGIPAHGQQRPHGTECEADGVRAEFTRFDRRWKPFKARWYVPGHGPSCSGKRLGEESEKI